MKYTLENDVIKLVVDSFASEMHELCLKENGINVLWNGNPKFWKGRNPTLFPQVGNTQNGIISFKGHEYKMGNHGICRDREFNLKSKTDNELVMELISNEDTKNIYPYDFKIEIKYVLKANRVDIIYRIYNEDSEELPFGFGLHPAFNCPLKSGENFEDYCIYFCQNEKEIVDKKLKLKEEMFLGDKTITINNPNSDSVILSNGINKIKVIFPAFPYLAIWKKEMAPFICIEPWMNKSGCFKDYNNNPKTDSIIRLKPKRQLLISYSIELA